jgi:hypothetical protein
MTAAPSTGMQVKVSLHEAAKAAGEHKKLRKSEFQKLISLLHSYPSLGTPVLSSEQGIVRCFIFNNMEIITHRITEEELQILSIRRP